MRLCEKSIMAARFRRKTVGSVTSASGIFGELDRAIARLIVSRADLGESEVPVLGSVFSDDEWVLVTTLRVVISREGQIRSVSNTDIRDLPVASIRWDAQSDLFNCRLTHVSLETFSGEQYELHVQPDVFLGVFSVLHMIADENWRERGRENVNPKWEFS